MNAVSITAVTLFIVIGVPVICITLVILTAILRGSGKNHRVQNEETRLIQEIHQGLVQMEKRIDSLETLVLDRESPPKGGHSRPAESSAPGGKSF